jgi:hypothetical protein
MSTRADYKATAERLRNPGAWLAIPRRLVARLSPAQAVVVVHVLNAGERNADPQGWVPYTVAYCRQGLGIEPDRQRSILERLRRAGVIEVDQRPVGRYVRLNIVRLEELAVQTAVGQR